MNALKKLREALGISQAEMAGLLGLEKGRIAMAETGKRSMPNETRMVIAWMLDELDGWPNSVEPTNSDVATIQKKIRRLESRLENLRLELEGRELKNQKAGFLQYICEAFESTFPIQISELAKKNIAVLQSIEDLRRDDELKNPLVFLKAKIKGLEAGIAFMKGLV